MEIEGGFSVARRNIKHGPQGRLGIQVRNIRPLTSRVGGCLYVCLLCVVVPTKKRLATGCQMCAGARQG